MGSKNWACNECNFQDYTDVIKEEELSNLQCSNCGGYDFHLVDNTRHQMKEQTPLERAISLLEVDKQEHLNDAKIMRENGLESVTEDAMFFALSMAISKLESLLPEERKVIEEAHNDATENYRKGYPTPILDGAVYYETKFK